jgi:hypothetical protein
VVQQHQFLDIGPVASAGQGKTRQDAGGGVMFILGEITKKAIFTVYHVGHHSSSGDATALEQQYMTQYTDETTKVGINISNTLLGTSKQKALRQLSSLMRTNH